MEAIPAPPVFCGKPPGLIVHKRPFLRKRLLVNADVFGNSQGPLAFPTPIPSSRAYENSSTVPSYMRTSSQDHPVVQLSARTPRRVERIGDATHILET